MGLELEGHVYRWAETRLTDRDDITILDTTWRDGTQASKIKHPRREDKEKLLEFVDKIGIEYADIAMPIARGPHFQDAVGLARFKVERGLSVKLVCLARSLPGDVDRAIELKKQSGLSELEVIVFKGSSPLRRQVQEWDVEKDLVVPIVESVKRAVDGGLKVTAATEDTTRTEPEVVARIFVEAMKVGATRLCIADTVGFSDPWSAQAIVKWIKENIIEDLEIGLDWHGHNDLGLSTANSLAALSAGADRVHVTISGVGERAGNAPFEEMVENLNQQGICKYDRRHVMDYAITAAAVFGRQIPLDRPITGDKVHSTPTGIHGAGIAKALKIGRPDLAGIVYSAVDPAAYGRKPELGVGPLSGVWNVESNLRRLNIEPTTENVQRVLNLAQMLYRELDDDEIRRAVESPLEAELPLWENNNSS